MKLRLRQYDYKPLTTMPHKAKPGIEAQPPLPDSKFSLSEMSFTSSLDSTINTFSKILDKKNNQIVYTNAQKLTQTIDSILGDSLFEKTLKKAGIAINSTKDELAIKNRSFIKDFLNTVKFPIYDLPLNIFSSIVSKFKNFNGPIGKLSNSILDSQFFTKRANNLSRQKNYELALDILAQFAPSKTGEKLNLNNLSENFKDNVSKKITKIVTNYDSRDERTLNRIATSTVSAIYGANDFFNISMLEKDDEKEAKKAQKGRFKQEMSRMALSAGITFITLGALNKHIKSMTGNAFIIAASALISEVVSRLFTKTPLKPLSPNEAYKKAQKMKQSNKENTVGTIPETEDDSNPAFKSKMRDTRIIFGDFAQSDGTFAPLKTLSKQNAKEALNFTSSKSKKERLSLKAKIGMILGITSAVYLLSMALKGKYKNSIDKKKLVEKYNSSIQSFINDDRYLDEYALSGIKELHDASKKNKFKLPKFFENIFNKKVTLDLSQLKENITNLQNSPDASSINKELETYIKHIDYLIRLNENNPKIEFCQKRSLILSSIGQGLSKVFKNLYSLFSAPGWVVDAMISKRFKKTNETFDMVTKKLGLDKKCDYKKEIKALNEIIKSAKTSNSTDWKKVIQTIQKRTRNFDSEIETGDLAAFSRTMVTAISTYFFVNDYTNKVLIESEGKNIDQAKEVRNERIAHKIANFFINGTLMNLFNTVFKKPLNNSLLQATLIAAATETTNEFLVRKSICQPITPQKSKQDILDYEQKQLNRKGPMGAWSKFFKKITGKKSLSEKTKV